MLLKIVIAFGLGVAWAEEQIPCGLPPFTGKLPEKQGIEMKATWANYTKGSCDDLQEHTFAILDTLTPEERTVVFGAPPQSDSFEHEGVPMFIRMMNPENKKAFDAIWLNSGIEDDVKHKKVSEFAKQNFKGDQLSNFNSWFDEVRRHKAAVDERIAKLSKKAKATLKKIIKIRAQEQDILAKMSKEVARELHGLI
ncbi:unnamed protein product, partial [Mesorhabditis belari]|uniref:Uncharacterized protein n=1 Tax=Mesorhabditis belari TaxID=2138241 RepID=A0AAF3E911_9BILA